MDRKLNDILELSQEKVELTDLLTAERLTEKYPYCSVLHAYTAKFAQVLNNLNKEKHLLLAAAYASERSCLKDFLDKPLEGANVSRFKKEASFVWEERFTPETVSEPQIAVQKSLSNTPKVEIKEEKHNILAEIDSYNEPDLSDNPTKEEVIERFLKIENPKVSNNPSELEDAAIDKIIKQSASDNFKIVTETMAKIYLKQGNKDKALQIYRQLLADNPKKSVYFAARIKELEENL